MRIRATLNTVGKTVDEVEAIRDELGGGERANARDDDVLLGVLAELEAIPPRGRSSRPLRWSSGIDTLAMPNESSLAKIK
jgi:hypothetical protein